jgi:hypothetical protein
MKKVKTLGLLQRREERALREKTLGTESKEREELQERK